MTGYYQQPPLLVLILLIVIVAVATVSVNQTAEPGQTVSLACQAPSNTDISVVEWTRPEYQKEYVLLLRDGWSDPHHQHPSFQNRVELKDVEMKDGDLSMILKNVTSNDTGTYECRVFSRGTNRRRRDTSVNEPISIIYLKIQSGDTEERGGEKGGGEKLHVGLGVVLTALSSLVLVLLLL